MTDEIVTGVPGVTGTPELLRGMREALLVEDANRRVEFANAAFAALFLGGAPPEVMLGVDCGAAARQSAEAFVEVSAWIEDTERTVVERVPVTGQLWHMADGTWVERDYVPRFDGDTFLGHSWIYRDVTDRESMRQHITELEHDLEASSQPLWSAHRAPARSTVLAIELAQEHGTCTVAVAKIENLDLVNGDLGHETGDHLISTLPARVTAVLPGAHVERVGGAAFAIVSTADPHAVIGAVHEAVGLTASGRGRTAMLNVLVGAVSADPAVRDARTHLQNARLALREARRVGSDMVLDPAAVAATAHRDQLGLALPGAIADGELRMVYQPVVSLADRSVVGHESLVRWDRPGAGTIAAGSFIAAAEILGLVVALDEWVIDRVVAESAQVLQRGGRTVGVNVSGRTLNTPGRLVPVIHAALERHGVPVERMVLEVTESAVASHTTYGIDALRELTDAGLRVAIDDFGVGSSSLATLKDVPFHAIKLDKTFAHGIEDPRVQSLVSVARSMAEELGAAVVAEGIEQEHQAELMQRCGVKFGQGWLLGMPT